MAKATGGTIAIFTGDMLLDGMGLFSTGWSTENYFKWGGHWVNVVTFIVEFHGASTRKERVGVVTKTAISFGIGVGAAAGLKKGGVAGAVTGPVGVVVVGLICAGVGALGGALGAW